MRRSALILSVLLTAALCAPVITPADHSFFPIYNMTHLSTTDGDVYNFHSPGFNYTFNGRSRFGFFSSVSLLFPVRSNQNGESFKNADYYDRKLGTDILVGAGVKLWADKQFSLVPSTGVHLNGIRLRGKKLYKDFSNLSLGIGINLQARYEIRSIMDLTGLVSTSWDFIDLIHEENKLENGFILTLGLGLTF
jgi:hypothetical protein